MLSRSSTYTIRRGSEADAPAMADIFNHYVATSPVIFSETILSADDMLRKIYTLVRDYPFLIAEDEQGGILGYCYAHLWMSDPVYRFTWELTEYLHTDARGRGVGTALLRAVIEQCRAAGAHTLISCVTDSNEPCKRMLLSLGFKDAGCLRHTGYKLGEWHDDRFFQLIF